MYQKLDVYSLPAEVLCINEVLLAGKVPYEIGDAMERTITRKNKFVYGEGRSDVVVYDSINARVAIFEAKYTKVLENLESECDIALQQIDDRMYAKEYEDDYDQILCYGISFFKRRCMVKKK